MAKTIAAISTPPGTGGIAVIRISGDDAVSIADKVFTGSVRLCDVKSHTVHYGYVHDGSGRKTDEVLVTVMRAPKTFTREDVVEISTHGGMTASRETLDAIILAGADIAEPGEFTKRAFLNGRIDLSQAEAVIDIINSTNTLAKNNALSQLEGTLSAEIKNIRGKLVQLASQMQVIIDYPDEDLEDVTTDDIHAICLDCLNDTKKLLSTADNGILLRDGIKTAIVGKPNVGKSSLLNLLSRTNRAIVTDIAGTTRDVIEEHVNLDGIPLILADTAGIHQTDDLVEKIGIEKSLQSIDDANLVIIVLDGSSVPDDDDMHIIKKTMHKSRIILINKTDILKGKYTEQIRSAANGSPVIEISALSGSGADELKNAIREIYNIGEISAQSGAVITNLRHKKALHKAQEALENAVGCISSGMPADIASIDINAAIEAFGEITGETVSDLIIDNIFHSFCVGK